MTKGAWEDVVGRTVAGVVLGEQDNVDVAYLCFTDGTCFEIFGGGFQGSSRLRFGSVAQTERRFVEWGFPFTTYSEVAPPLDPDRVPDGTYIGEPDPEIVGAKSRNTDAAGRARPVDGRPSRG